MAIFKSIWERFFSKPKRIRLSEGEFPRRGSDESLHRAEARRREEIRERKKKSANIQRRKDERKNPKPEQEVAATDLSSKNPPKAQKITPTPEETKRQRFFVSELIRNSTLLSREAALEAGPSNRLLLAVLEEALIAFQRGVAVTDYNNARKNFLEAKEWIASDDDKWPFAFLVVCEALSIDPEYIRTGLKQLEKDKRGGRKKKNRNKTVTKR